MLVRCMGGIQLAALGAVYTYEFANESVRGVRITERFGAHPISHTKRIDAYFKLDTILFSGKHHFSLPIG
jgi:hypothetical protein